MERVTGIGGVFQRAGQTASLRHWYAEHLGIDISGSFMVNFRVADLDALLAQLRAAGVEVVDALEESEYGRFGWAVDPDGTRFELWEPPPGQ